MSTNSLSSIPRPKAIIRTRLIVNASITIALALVVALTVYLQHVNVRRAERTERFAHDVIKGVSDLNALGFTYLLLKDERPEMQWQMKQESLGKLLSEPGRETPGELSLRTELRSNLGQMKGLFDVMAKVNKESTTGVKGAALPYDELNEGVVAQLMARSEMMINAASQLEREAARNMDAVQRWSFLLVIVSTLALIMSAIVTAFFLVRSIAGSIRTLRRGTERIAAGDLTYRLGMPALDELGELGGAFDNMLEVLHAVTVSKNSLEQEIEQRKGVEEALLKARENLELRVQERTGLLQEAYIKLEMEVAERKKTEDALHQSQKMEAIGTLAGGIAHDFNNMLAAILGFTEMALEDIPDRPDVERNLQNVSKAAMRARDLVKQILAFSRKADHARSPLSLSSLIKETVQLLRASISTTIDIRLSITATSDTVLAAPVEIQQILMNLATNASLAMQEKRGTMDISLTDIDFEPDSPVFGVDISPGEYVQLMVKDTGTGMGPDVMKRVFEPFFTTREVGKGTGMGLAVVYGIVKDLQGTITVESEVGVSSTFSVLLPKVKTDAQTEVAQPVETPRGTERILFVDDEEMLVEWGRATLEKLGYKVTAVTESQEALKTFSMDPSLFDLLITDHAMPQMAGAQLAKEFLNVRRDIPIILCTGHSDNISPESSREIGVKEFLMKPVSKQELAEAVRRALDGKDWRTK